MLPARCEPAGAGDGVGSRCSRLLMRIDLHTHIVPEQWEDFAARYGGGRWPRLVHRDACRATIMTGDAVFREVTIGPGDPERRIEDMDRLGIDRQVLSPPPVMFCYWAEARAAQAFARMQNESVAAIVARHPRRFVGMATVPLQDPSSPSRSCGTPASGSALRAVEIGTCPGGRDFDDPALFPFFAACRDLDVAVFVHPAAPLVGQERLTKYYFPLIVGQSAGDGGRHLEADFRRRARAPARPAHLLRARRRRVPVHARPARPRLVGAPGGPGVDPEAHRASMRGCFTSTRSRTARRTSGSWSPSSAPSGWRWAATTRSTWGAPIRCPAIGEAGLDPGARALVEGGTAARFLGL